MTLPFADIETRLDLLAGVSSVQDAVTLADQALRDGEAVLEAWLRARGQEPTLELVEGYRLLALHRQGARGDASFNACRETCRELIYLRNVVAVSCDTAREAEHQVRLQAMVLRHLVLFVGGKMVEAGLGDFCCSARPLRQGDRTQPEAATLAAG